MVSAATDPATSPRALGGEPLPSGLPKGLDTDRLAMTLSHERRGTGEPMLLLHGVGMEWRVWLPVMDALNGAGFQTIAADVPGFGDSPPLPPERAPTIQALAQAVAGFLDELGLQHAHLVGNSMGGGIALELARSGRASSVTAISPVGLWTPRELRFCQRSLRLTLAAVRTAPALLAGGSSSPLVRTLLGAQIFSRPWRIPPQRMREMIDALAGASGFLPTVSAFECYTLTASPELEGVPVTILWGSSDRLLLRRQADRARRLLGHARHISLQHLGHVPMWDDPALVSAAIIAAARS